MPTPSSPRKTTGRPARISREEVIEAGGRILAEEGADRLTMRRLAAEVGTTPMALYHHVRDKEELLLLLLDEYAAQAMRRPEPTADPREQTVAAAAAIHDALIACPWVADLLTADDLMSRAALWFVEQIVDGLIRSGLTPERAVHGYRAIWYYTLGEITITATAAKRRQDPRPTRREQIFTALDPADLPRLAQLADRWTPLTGADTYLDGLRALVNGLTSA
jgi:AcrR family transcriptional regulator